MPLGKVEVSHDAHSGQRSIRFVRSNEPPTVETGVNARSIDRLKGGMDFHYKAISARDVILHIYAIPIGAKGIENTGAPRAAFAVPGDHVGDGIWHHARLRYDFTSNPAVKSVIFAVRLEGQAGELLLDDVSYVERVGPLLRIGKIHVQEDAQRPGEQCLLHALVENRGDTPAADLRVRLDLPDCLKTTPRERALGSLVPDGHVWARWTVTGSRTGASIVRMTATSGQETMVARLEIKPQLVLMSWGPAAPVIVQGETLRLECLLHNAGHATVLHPRALFQVGSDQAESAAERILPGQTLRLRVSVSSKGLSSSVSATVEVRADKIPLLRPSSRASVTVLQPVDLPPPSGALKVSATAACALLENEHLRLVFPRSGQHFGPGELSVRTARGWQRVAWMEQLGTVAVIGENRRPEEVSILASTPPEAEAPTNRPARLRFTATAPDKRSRIEITFETTSGARTIRTRAVLIPLCAGQLTQFAGPMLNVLERDEAIVPGVEWLVDAEVSSGTLDIAPTHPDRDRTVVHPNWITISAIGIHSRHGTVGLLWDVHQKWDGIHDRPSVWFSSPDCEHNRRSHRLGLFVHSNPKYRRPIHSAGTGQAQPFPLDPGKPLQLESLLYADGFATDALSAVDEWMRTFGLPQPAPLPRGSYEREIEFSMQAYLKSLWLPTTKEWWTSKGGGILSTRDRPRAFVADLLAGSLLSPDSALRRQCRTRAEEVLALIGGEPRLDAQRFPERLDLALANTASIAGLLRARDRAGVWRFDADQVGTGPFVGRDYHDLGPDHAAEVGTCAARATTVLRYARITGDRTAFQEMLKTLEIMERFRVPRAAQVWEVPVHSPDILAAGEAVEAFLEAYHFSGDPRWLRDAVTWARRGLPFVYLWNDPDRPFLLGASIPVFGATWKQGSWFGRPVQWNGLRYAEALRKLAEHDKSYPWKQIALTLTHSALYQQETRGENVALWPDNIGAVEADRCAWVFAPRMILTNVLALMGRSEDVATLIVGQGDRRLHINANAQLADARWDERTCRFRVTYSAGEQGIVVLFNVSRPTAVMLNGKPVPERPDIETGSAPGWRYQSGVASLAIRVQQDGLSQVHIDGALFRPGPCIPQLATTIAFVFSDSPQGWIAAHDVDELSIKDGVMTGKITGRDPYLVRPMLRVRGETCPVVVVRMRVSAGQGGQLYWTTESSPLLAEDKVINFPIQADGQFHDYRLEPGKHHLWTGQTITSLRIDPGNGARSADFSITFIRGEAVPR
jgi:hypothetical protein